MTFDTIRFRLLNLALYEDCGFSLVKGERVTRGGMYFMEMKNKMYEVDRDEYVKATITSASYEINYHINLDQNSALFEFSIPKYIYGNNLEHYPPSPGNEHKDLCLFLEEFFLYEFKLKVNLEDIEILRLDLCYNYRFESLDNKEAYKLQMTQLFKAHFGEHLVQSYSTNDTVMYKTQDYSFKIYDKGKEFKKHDYTKVLKLKGRKVADQLLEKSSLILRAELTFRKRKISYDFFQNIDKTDQVSWLFKEGFRDLKKHRDACVAILETLARRLNKIVKVDSRHMDQAARNEYVNRVKSRKEYRFYSGMTLDHMISVAEQLRTKKVRTFTEYTATDLTSIIKKPYRQKMRKYTEVTAPKKIRLRLNSFERAMNRAAAYPKLLEFDERLLGVMLDKFQSIYNDINSFQPANFSALNALHYNRKAISAAGIRVNEVKKYLALRQQYTDKQIMSRGLLSRATLYRYKAILKQINTVIQEKNPEKSINTLPIPEKMKPI